MPAQSNQAAVVHQISKMRRSLIEWLKYRRLLDDAAAKNPDLAAHVEKVRDWKGEANLAERLYDIMMKVVKEEKLPNPQDKGASVVLAQMALTYGGKQAAGAVPTWLIGVGIGAIALIAVSGNIASGLAAKEKAECIKAGACSDDSVWKFAAVLGGAYLVWNAFGVGDAVRGTVKSAGDRVQRHIRGSDEETE